MVKVWSPILIVAPLASISFVISKVAVAIFSAPPITPDVMTWVPLLISPDSIDAPVALPTFTSKEGFRVIPAVSTTEEAISKVRLPWETEMSYLMPPRVTLLAAKLRLPRETAEPLVAPEKFRVIFWPPTFRTREPLEAFALRLRPSRLTLNVGSALETPAS